MQESLIETNEINRLNALLNMNIPDIPRESIFDEIVKVTSIICQTPIALISLLDDKRLCVKAKIGINISEIIREISFCNHTIQQDSIFIVENALEEDRFKNNPMVAGEPYFVFYAGVPISTGEGLNIGTLCVLNTKPQKLKQEQINSLKTFSKIVASFIAMKSQNSFIHYLKGEVQKSALKLNTCVEDLIRTKKLASIVEMASNVSHEINNPLAIIQGKTYLLLKMLENRNFNSESSKIYLNSICSTVSRISKIIKGLKNFSRNSDEDFAKKVNVYKIITHSVDILDKIIFENKIDVRVEVSNSSYILAKEQQLVQCIVCLIINSIEALNRLDLEKKWIIIESIEKNGMLDIKVTDSGAGIQIPSILEHLMEPFFTTKETGKGVGLGLSVVKGIIESHKGNFFYNNKCENTQFIIELPLLN